MKTAWVCVLGVVLGGGSVAFAQPGADPTAPDPTGAPGMSPPPPSTVSTEPAVPGADQGVIDDAMSPGAFLSPTALTEPEGTLTVSLGAGADDGFNNSELTNVSGSFAVTNELTVGGSVLLPSEDERIYVLSAKLQLLRTGRVRVAAQANLLFDSDRNYAVIAGGVATVCLDHACNSTANGYVGVGFFADDGSAVPIAVSGSIVYQVVPHVKLVGELLTGFATSDISGIGDELLAFYGVRITHQQVGVNLGFIKALGDADSSGPGELFASVTGRLFTK